MALSGSMIRSSVAAVLAQAPEDYLTQARTMVERHEINQAIEILDKGLQSFPRNPDVLTQLGLLLIATGNLGAGDELLSRALAIRPLDRRDLQGRAEAQLRQGALAEAAGLFERAVEQAPLNVPYRRLYALLLRLQDRSEESTRQLRMAVSLAPPCCISNCSKPAGVAAG